MSRRPEERVQVLGGSMDLVRPEEVFHFVAGKIAARESAVVANHNLHSLYLIRKDQKIAEFFRTSDLIEVDSVPLIFWARIVGRASRRFHRCTYLDWRDAFWQRAIQENWKVFFVGGAPGVGEKATARIQADWPSARIRTHHGYFDVTPGSAENQAVVDAINDYRPDIVLVGMGMPRQEVWVLENQAKLGPCVTFTVGGAFDYEAGVQRPSPRWMGQVGMEWLFRLMVDPQRLFTRYCVEPWHLMGPALQDVRRALARQVVSGTASEVARKEYVRASDLARSDSLGGR
ncbi:N-acetylglucosaminyldiphosphoundecaprenol N-acetyl-beta-D-mannosaminyltransferase [Caulobacter sp. BE254]|nr:WecB/TagA/CpsF family glycosyltransferase [Caulobacter sp. BE254]MDR7115025.1 N-acetylglucosaminyldiphosphoundecaprenol N-acetyl-beta-D-mannosaminyltransferase [Caulobacter sp. BE254]